MEDFNAVFFNPEKCLDELTSKEFKVHLRIQQRNARKCVTIVENLELEDEELEKFVATLKKRLSTNGTIKKKGRVVTFHGDQRQAVRAYLIEQMDMDEENIIMHGFE